MASGKDLDFYSPFTDNPAGSAASGNASGSNSFGGETFGGGSDATRTPVLVDEVQFADFGQSGGGLDVMSPAPSGLSKAP